MTVAPLVANGVLITGMSGAEFGIRGFIDGWDPETGKHLWRRYTIPARGEPGNETWPQDTDAWKHGGGSSLDHRLLRSRARSHLLGHRQSGAVGVANAAGRQSVHVLGAGDAAQDRRGRLALPVHARRRLRLRRLLGADPRRHRCGGRQAQGADAAQPQRLPLRDRPHQRQADLGQALREGELGEPRRHENRPAGRDRDRQAPARRRAGRALADPARRQELAARRVQSADRASSTPTPCIEGRLFQALPTGPFVPGQRYMFIENLPLPPRPKASRSVTSRRSIR